MIRTVPMINTARLTLCGMRPEDFERYARIWQDPDVVRFKGLVLVGIFYLFGLLFNGFVWCLFHILLLGSFRED